MASIPADDHNPSVHHPSLHATFLGVRHRLSSTGPSVNQFLGIKYASIPARFRQSQLLASYPSRTLATSHGPICPQPKMKHVDARLFGLSPEDIPQQKLAQDEFECLNLNITCPGDLAPQSHLPVMLWIHGGGSCGSGSNWLCDGGALVQKSIELNHPIILVTINYRLGLLGFASSPALLADNAAAGDPGVGNYGLRDQRTALEWIHAFIAPFGGDPENITLFGEGTGAADILCHMHSRLNQTRPLFKRAICQSVVMEVEVPKVEGAGWFFGRLVGQLGGGCGVSGEEGVKALREADVQKVAAVGGTMGWRATDDGDFFREGWRESLYPDSLDAGMDHGEIEELQMLGAPQQEHALSPSRTHMHLQPLLIGDVTLESHPTSVPPASAWTSPSLTRRVRAIVQSMPQSSALLRAYDLCSQPQSSTCATTEAAMAGMDMENELSEKVLELINDARYAWVTECLARRAARERSHHHHSGHPKSLCPPHCPGAGMGGEQGEGAVWRYVFDQESPIRSRALPHHKIDLLFLFDTVPHRALAASLVDPADVELPDHFDISDDEDEEYDDDEATTEQGDEYVEGEERCAEVEGCETPDMCFGSDNSTDSEGRITPLDPPSPVVRVDVKTRRMSAPTPPGERAFGVPRMTPLDQAMMQIPKIGLKSRRTSAPTPPFRSERHLSVPGHGAAQAQAQGSSNGADEHSYELEVTTTVTTATTTSTSTATATGYDPVWDLPPPMTWTTYEKVSRTMASKWFHFAYGGSPWTPYRPPSSSSSTSALPSALSSPRHHPHPHEPHQHSHHHPHQHHQSPHHHPKHPHMSEEGRVFVFGPEGELGERCHAIFEGRRRVDVWRAAFEGAGSGCKEGKEGMGMGVVMKVGAELCNGPPAAVATRGGGRW